MGEFADTYTETPDPNPNYGYLSWEEIGQLGQERRVEIQNHSYNLHHQQNRKGAGQKKGGEHRSVSEAPPRGFN